MNEDYTHKVVVSGRSDVGHAKWNRYDAMQMARAWRAIGQPARAVPLNRTYRQRLALILGQRQRQRPIIWWPTRSK